MSLTFAFFLVLGFFAIASAVVTISNKNPVTSALSLVFHFFMLAGLYLTLNAQFVAVIQVLVYAGAIMVLVIFVIMLLNLGDEEKLKEKLSLRKGVGILLALGLAVQLSSVFLMKVRFNAGQSNLAVTQSSAQAIGKELFSNYLLPFEAVSLLLMTAILGAMVLAKKNVEKL